MQRTDLGIKIPAGQISPCSLALLCLVMQTVLIFKQERTTRAKRAACIEERFPKKQASKGPTFSPFIARKAAGSALLSSIPTALARMEYDPFGPCLFLANIWTRSSTGIISWAQASQADWLI
eukprot:1142488-Pelagomonas_calceolata.AAC.13